MTPTCAVILENFIQESKPELRENLKTSILIQKATGLLICKLPASDTVLVYKVPQMDQAEHAQQRPLALAALGLMVFPGYYLNPVSYWGLHM